MVTTSQTHAVIRNAASTDDIEALQKQITEVKDLNVYLQARVRALEDATRGASSIQTSQDTSRIEALENRVSLLEGTINTIKVNVMAALQTTISLIQKLIK